MTNKNYKGFGKEVKTNYPRKGHTIRVSLTNEENGREEWGDYGMTFFNEDNAINHLNLLGKFLEFACEEENTSWGLGYQDEGLVERYANWITKKVSPPSFKGLVKITEITDEMK